MKNRKQVATGAKTNDVKGSLVKVEVKAEPDVWKTPKENELCYINENATFPEINFELDISEEQSCQWAWEITWAAATSGMRESKNRGRTINHFCDRGKSEQSSIRWTANLDEQCLGGTLKVTATVAQKKFVRHVRIIAVNPSEELILTYLATFNDAPGFEKIIRAESSFKQFINADGEPIVSFDGGYGLTQMTNPKPTYIEAWDWKANIQAGMKLYKSKRREAENFLSGSKKSPRNYTEDQLQLETWCRWNSGKYHIWDEANRKWIRNPEILGDSQTGNIGWDMKRPENKGKTEEILHKRDSPQYSKPKTSSSSWRYSGVVYADHIKDK